VLAPLLTLPQVSEAWPGLTAETVGDRGGARVIEVAEDGPATKIVQPDDVVRGVDGAPVRDLFDFLIGVVQHRPGERVRLTLTRDGAERDVMFALAALPVPPPKKLLYDRLGVAAEENSPAVARRRRLAVDSGIVITTVWPRGPADNAGLKESDVILQIGASPVTDLREAAAVLRTMRPGQDVFILILRGRQRAYTWIPLGE
jgi:S1-C subfamily serine protease